MKKCQSLNDVSPGESAVIKEICSVGSIRRRLLDIGLIENTRVSCVGQSPLGDPVAFMIRGAIIAIRRDDCCNIYIK